jgi:hypothetical protein
MGAANVGPLPIVPDELVSGIGDMRAQRSEEIQCGTRKGAWRVGAGTSVMILAGIGDAAGEKMCRGRNAGCPAPPAQIRTGAINAYGSYLGWLALNRTCGKG